MIKITEEKLRDILTEAIASHDFEDEEDCDALVDDIIDTIKADDEEAEVEAEE
jgi:hypothetical protein